MSKKKKEEVSITIGDAVYKLVDFDDVNVGCEDCDIQHDFGKKECEICFTLDLFDRNAVFQLQRD